ncbi:MAG: type II toxin-antitoxin system PemK/MazF family toxin [Thermodesulfobacteriota bacterium]|nr:type II toxin-antitoxin system PemK/MazF family toxin [Thermodesulfobacteriota bacterium]
MIYEQFDVVVVPFPFSDRFARKRRPALVLSRKSTFGDKVQHSVLAMITSKKNTPWPLDVPIQNGKSAGLTAPSVIRMKLFTLDNQLILRTVGRLSKTDQAQLKEALSQLFGQMR